jgi:hypothetical protein
MFPRASVKHVLGQIRAGSTGQIASGWPAGALVHETGHLVDAAALEFAGTIQIQP